jgi:hypothetical protein
LPYNVRKTDGAHKVVVGRPERSTPGHTTKDKAERQRRLLEGVRHGWKPTGKKKSDVT